MSLSLYWHPTKISKKSFSDDLKNILRSRFGGPVDQIFNLDNIDYVEGLVDGKVNGAIELLEALKKYESIRVWEE